MDTQVAILADIQEYPVSNRVPLAVELKQLGDKFKELERVHVRHLDKTKYTIIRVDGHCFHTFTKQFDKPYDSDLAYAMIYACSELIKQFNGICAYTQSDEATMIIDRIPANSNGELPFSARVEKIATLSASLFSVYFNESLRDLGVVTYKPAIFDSRIFQVDTEDDVQNVIRWRQLDGFRNGVAAIARSLFSTKELHGVGVGGMLKMIDEDTLKIYEQSHLVHGTFVKKARVTKIMPDGEACVRTEIKYRCLGKTMRVVNYKKGSLTKYLGVVEKAHVDDKTDDVDDTANNKIDDTVGDMAEIELNRLLKNINENPSV